MMTRLYRTWIRLSMKQIPSVLYRLNETGEAYINQHY